MQDPDSQLLEMRVEDEIALGLENRGLKRPEIVQRMQHIMAETKIEHLAGRDPSTLSGGEKQRLCIAAALVLRPDALILDEPFTDLDSEGVDRLIQYLNDLSNNLGIAIVLLDKKVPNFPAPNSSVIVLKQGRLLCSTELSSIWQDFEFWKEAGVISSPLAEIFSALGIRSASTTLSHAFAMMSDAAMKKRMLCSSISESEPKSTGAYCDDTAIACKGLRYLVPDASFDLRVDLDIARGEMVGILGPNGGGKSTLLRLIGGLLRPSGGQVLVLGLDPLKGNQIYLRQRLGMSFQNPVDQLFLYTVEKNLRFSIESSSVDKALTDTRPAIERTATDFGLKDVLNSSPEELSYSERHRAALASILVNDNLEIVLLDEPTRGLDLSTRELLFGLLAKLKRKGVTVVITTHDSEFIYGIADRILLMHCGSIVRDGSPQSVFHDSDLRNDFSVAPPFLVDACRILGYPPVTNLEEFTWRLRNYAAAETHN